MKGRLVSLTCLLLASHVLAVSIRKPSHASKIDKKSSDVALAKHADAATHDATTAPPCDCPGNLFPGDCSAVIDARGKNKFAEIFKVVQANGLPLESWKTGVTFKLKMKVTSTDAFTRRFGFGVGSKAFLNVTVEPGATDLPVVVEDEVLRGDFTFQFLDVVSNGPSAVDAYDAMKVENVKFTQICLTTPMCTNYVCSKSSWAKKANADIPGNSDLECCEEKKCGTYTCTPATKWQKKADSDGFIGFSNERCCVPIMCADSVCSAADTKPISGTGLQGNTVDECCEAAKCSLYKCSHPTQFKPKANPHDSLMGKDDATCCDEQLCSAYTCSDTSLFKANASLAAGTKGSTDDECCEPQWCDTYTCSSTSKYTKKTGKIQGQSDKHCCQPKLCSNHRCSTQELTLIAGAQNRYGSTNAECCEKKFCKDYNCSDATKWWKKADLDANGLRLRGFTDQECCEPRFCQQHTCAPSSAWKTNASLTADVKGSTSEQCCEPVWCTTYTCSKPTKWTKKIDTNSFKHQGSTDLECCEPKWCSQFFTPYPSKWIRKQKPDGSIDESLQGSSESECYEPRYCSSFTCPPHKKLGNEPHKMYGSTEAECCVPV